MKPCRLPAVVSVVRVDLYPLSLGWSPPFEFGLTSGLLGLGRAPPIERVRVAPRPLSELVLTPALWESSGWPRPSSESVLAPPPPAPSELARSRWPAPSDPDLRRPAGASRDGTEQPAAGREAAGATRQAHRRAAAARDRAPEERRTPGEWRPH